MLISPFVSAFLLATALQPRWGAPARQPGTCREEEQSQPSKAIYLPAPSRQLLYLRRRTNTLTIFSPGGTWLVLVLNRGKNLQRKPPEGAVGGWPRSGMGTHSPLPEGITRGSGHHCVSPSPFPVAAPKGWSWEGLAKVLCSPQEWASLASTLPLPCRDKPSKLPTKLSAPGPKMHLNQYMSSLWPK